MFSGRACFVCARLADAAMSAYVAFSLEILLLLSAVVSVLRSTTSKSSLECVRIKKATCKKLCRSSCPRLIRAINFCDVCLSLHSYSCHALFVLNTIKFLFFVRSFVHGRHNNGRNSEAIDFAV